MSWSVRPASSIRALWAVGTVLLLASFSEVQAFVSEFNGAGVPQKWNLTIPSVLVHTNVVNPRTRAIRYFLAADAYSSAHKVAELNAARACFDQWQAVPGSILRFEEGGLVTGNADVNTKDNTNLIFWAKTTTVVDGGYSSISGATGVTFSDVFSDSTIAEADIALNGVDFTWFADGTDTLSQGQFVESVLLHEVGHLIGLAHSPVGASTMYPRGAGGIGVQAGLSSDEIAGLLALYPANPVAGTLARLTGVVTLNSSKGAPVLGAIVCADSAVGNTVAGTMTLANGSYDMPGMPPGPYQVRVTPLDPGNSSYWLFTGVGIARGTNGGPYALGNPNFLATTNTPVTLVAGATAKLDFTVTSGTPNFRIGRIGTPASDPFRYSVVNYAAAMTAGEGAWLLRVYSSDLPSPTAVLRLTGDGLTFDETTLQTNAFPGLFPPLNLLSVPVHVAASATPGMRTLFVQQGSGLTYANGFVELSTPFPDYNFDGLDDRFQRQYFPRWTLPEAGPNADPDKDGFSNLAEYVAGSNPSDAKSVLSVESVRFDASGATVSCRSAAGKLYQLLGRPKIDSNRPWQAVGHSVISTGAITELHDPAGAANIQFYRVEALPNP